MILDNLDLNTDQDSKIIQIKIEDIQDDISFGESAILCYVLGANLPQNVMEGFVRCIWGGGFRVDRVSLVGRGMYLVRLTTMENSRRSFMVVFSFLMGCL